MYKLRRYLKAYRLQMILGPTFKLIEAIFELIVPILTARMIDYGVRRGDVAYVWHMGALMLLMGFIGLCSTLVCQKMAAIASQGVGTLLRNELYEQVNEFSHKEIDFFGTPSLITRITSDVNQLQSAVAMMIRLVVRAPFLALGAIVMAMSLNVHLGIIFLIVTPLIVLVLYIIMSRSIPFFKMMQKKLDRISLVSREGLSGVRVIRAFSRQNTEQERFDKAADEQTNTAIRVGKLSALLNPLTYVIMNFGIVAIIWFGGSQVYAGSLTQGEVIAFINYMTQTLLALIVVANLVVLFTKASASAARVNEVLETVSSVQPGTLSELTPAKNTPKVSFENVSFSYDDSEKYALEHLNLKVEPGQTVGIIGGTGSGKSTLANLITRFYDVTQGVLKIDGVDVKEYTFEFLRSKVSIVPQDAMLFSGTIESNLLWGNETAQPHDLERALRIAQAEEFVKHMPEGIQSPVSQGGKNFSGGQRQRLTIARALAANPEILILDDSASALDFATDAALRRALKHETKEMTVFIISQRVSAVKQADQILVLDDGNTAGLGTHEELLKTCQVYQEICLSQLSRSEVYGGLEKGGQKE